MAKQTISGNINRPSNISGSATSGNGTFDHSKLYNRDAENQHSISSIVGLSEVLKNKACGMYYDLLCEFADRPYWYLCSEINPVTKLGTKESIISGPYDLGSEGGADGRFVITDPTENQVLLYDDESGKWVNKDLADTNSIIYLNNQGLTIKGYDTATNGQMLVKDGISGLSWQDPVSLSELSAAVTAAEGYAQVASEKSIAANNSAVAANISAGQATSINLQTMNWVNNKFWWGTQSEYNALTSISPGTFYFITTDDE